MISFKSMLTCLPAQWHGYKHKSLTEKRKCLSCSDSTQTAYTFNQFPGHEHELLFSLLKLHGRLPFISIPKTFEDAIKQTTWANVRGLCVCVRWKREGGGRHITSLLLLTHLPPPHYSQWRKPERQFKQATEAAAADLHSAFWTDPAGVKQVSLVGLVGLLFF